MADVWKNSFDIAMKYVGDRQGCSIDAGCRSGQWSEHLVEVFDFTYGFDYRSKPAHLRKLINKTANKKFQFFNCALGEDNYVTKTKSGVGRIKGKGDMKVEVRTLDSFNILNVAFIKLDCEGYEPKILQGAKNTILRDKPVICCEINRDDNNSREILESWGYECKEVDDLQGHDYFFVYEGE